MKEYRILKVEGKYFYDYTLEELFNREAQEGWEVKGPMEINLHGTYDRWLLEREMGVRIDMKDEEMKEYKILDIEVDYGFDNHLVSRLNKEAQEGWKVIGPMEPSSLGFYDRWLLERELERTGHRC
jgi:beta-galactosidase GanA